MLTKTRKMIVTVIWSAGVFVLPSSLHAAVSWYDIEPTETTPAEAAAQAAQTVDSRWYTTMFSNLGRLFNVPVKQGLILLFK